MFATTIILALLLGFFIGVTACVTAVLYWDSNDRKKRNKKKAEKLDQAVKIVNEYDYTHN